MVWGPFLLSVRIGAGRKFAGLDAPSQLCGVVFRQAFGSVFLKRPGRGLLGHYSNFGWGGFVASLLDGSAPMWLGPVMVGSGGSCCPRVCHQGGGVGGLWLYSAVLFGGGVSAEHCYLRIRLVGFACAFFEGGRIVLLSCGHFLCSY